MNAQEEINEPVPEVQQEGEETNTSGNIQLEIDDDTNFSTSLSLFKAVWCHRRTTNMAERAVDFPAIQANIQEMTEHMGELIRKKLVLVNQRYQCILTNRIDLVTAFENHEENHVDDLRTELNHNYFFKNVETLPVHWCTYFGNFFALQIILEANPDQAKSAIDGIITKAYSSKAEGSLPLHIALAKGYDISWIEYLLSKFPEAITVANKHGQLPIHIAARMAPLECVRYILEKYPEALCIEDKEGRMPLHEMMMSRAYNVEEERIRLFIERYPKALSHRSHDDTLTDNVPLAEIIRETNDQHLQYVKMVYEYGIQYHAFGDDDNCGGLFEQVNFNVNTITLEDGTWEEEYLDDVVMRSVLEFFLIRHRRSARKPSYAEGWDELIEVFGPTIFTCQHDRNKTSLPILHAAIGNIHDVNLFPIMINKFHIDLTQKDLRGRTALIITIYNTVFYMKHSKEDIEDENDDLDFHDCEEDITLSDTRVSLEDSIAQAHDLMRRRDRQCQDSSVRFMLGHSNYTTSDKNLSGMMSPAMIYDDDGRLPLHLASDIGLEWCSGTEDILCSNMIALQTQDPVTGLYPFMLAGVGDADLTSVWRLFTSQADILERL